MIRGLNVESAQTLGQASIRHAQVSYSNLGGTMSRHTTLLGFAFAAALASPIAGQMPGGLPERHLIRIGFGGGVSVPTSNAADALKNGINGQAFILLDPGFGFPIRLNLGYQKFDLKEALLQGFTGENRILSGVGGISLNLFSLGPLRPYITAGVGAFNVHQEISGGPAAMSESKTNFGIDGGGGLALKIGRFEAFIEGRVQNVYTEQGVIDTKSIRAVPVTFGILF
jgi:hypothetical protein